jgi:YbbR domain-containing protein
MALVARWESWDPEQIKASIESHLNEKEECEKRFQEQHKEAEAQKLDLQQLHVQLVEQTALAASYEQLVQGD